MLKLQRQARPLIDLSIDLIKVPESGDWSGSPSSWCSRWGRGRNSQSWRRTLWAFLCGETGPETWLVLRNMFSYYWLSPLIYHQDPLAVNADSYFFKAALKTMMDCKVWFGFFCIYLCIYIFYLYLYYFMPPALTYCQKNLQKKCYYFFAGSQTSHLCIHVSASAFLHATTVRANAIAREEGYSQVWKTDDDSRLPRGEKKNNLCCDSFGKLVDGRGKK